MLNKHWCLVSVFIICTLILGGISEAQDQSEKTVYEKVIEQLESLTPGEAIEVRMGTEKDEYDIGDPFEVRFQVSEDCYIVLMDIGSATKKGDTYEYGDITFLIPSFKLTENKVEGGRVYSTLYDFELPIKVAPPAGYETVNLFCSPEQLNLFDADFSKQGVYTVTPDDTEKLEQLLARLEQLEQQEWSGTSVAFFIKGARGGKKFGALPGIGATGTTGKFFPKIGATGTTGKQ